MELDGLMTPQEFEEFCDQENPRRSAGAHARSADRAKLLSLFKLWAYPEHCQNPAANEASLLSAALGPARFKALAARWSPTPAALWRAVEASAKAGRWRALAGIRACQGFDDGAIAQGQREPLAALLLSHGAYALGQKERWEAHLQAPLDPHWADAQGRTLLRLCVVGPRLDLAARLLAVGADPCAAAADRMTPMQAAVAQDRLELAKMMAGASPAAARDPGAWSHSLAAGKLAAFSILVPPAGFEWLPAAGLSPLARMLDEGDFENVERQGDVEAVRAMADRMMEAGPSGRAALAFAQAQGLAMGQGLERCAKILGERAEAALERMALECSSAPGGPAASGPRL